MSYTIEPVDDRAAWLKERRKGIGSSDIAAIMGISPYTTPFQVWASKVGDLPDDEGTEAMQWGSILENVILDEWERQHQEVTARGVLVRSEDRPWMVATPDGITTTPDGDGAVAEVKNINDYSWDEVPDYYVAQVQWQMAVTGYEMAYVIVLHAGRRMETYPVPADNETQTAMVEAATEFWALVEADEAPPVEADDNAILASLWPYHTEAAVEVPVELATELYEARAAHAVATARREAAEAAVKATLGEADTAVVGQAVVATWRTSTSRRIDTKRLKAERPEVASEYENESTSRRFLVKGDSL